VISPTRNSFQKLPQYAPPSSPNPVTSGSRPLLPGDSAPYLRPARRLQLPEFSSFHSLADDPESQAAPRGAARGLTAGGRRRVHERLRRPLGALAFLHLASHSQTTLPSAASWPDGRIRSNGGVAFFVSIGGDWTSSRRVATTGDSDGLSLSFDAYCCISLLGTYCSFQSACTNFLWPL
jgi:hypothetical protein